MLNIAGLIYLFERVRLGIKNCMLKGTKGREKRNKSLSTKISLFSSSIFEFLHFLLTLFGLFYIFQYFGKPVLKVVSVNHPHRPSQGAQTRL